jgi:hypothetical protein
MLIVVGRLISERPLRSHKRDYQPNRGDFRFRINSCPCRCFDTVLWHLSRVSKRGMKPPEARVKLRLNCEPDLSKLNLPSDQMDLQFSQSTPRGNVALPRKGPSDEMLLKKAQR